MKDLFCPFRLNIRGHGESEVATCGYVQQVIGVNDPTIAEVHRSACEACCNAFPTMAARLNPVLPSLLFAACEQATEPDERASDQIARIRKWSEETLLIPPGVYRQHTIHGCDVVLYAETNSDECRAAITSILDQERIEVCLHLIDATPDAAFTDCEDTPRIRRHRDPGRQGLFHHLHRLLTQLTTHFVAIQTCDSISHPVRLAHALARLDEDGAEFFVSAVDTPEGMVDSHVQALADGATQPAGDFMIETLVVRRSSLIDMGGIADAGGTTLSESRAASSLVCRAVQQKRRIVNDSLATVELHHKCQPTLITDCVLSEPPGFATSERFACDVVLPFRGGVEMAEQSIAGIVEQEGADTVVHLIDDGSPENVTDFLNRWKTHSNVRVYRNTKNIGQFASFNNIEPWMETEFAAVQDGDDISRPNRIRESCRHLQFTHCELFASATQMFGEPELMKDVGHEQLDDGTWIRRSVFPSARNPSYFLENPTLVVRVSAFRRLGGFADFGSGPRARTSLDTEFMNRAYLAGARICVSQQILVDYRCHGSSATQNTDTGFGSTSRDEANRENNRRVRLMLSGPFDPRDFGSLGRYEGVTVRL